MNLKEELEQLIHSQEEMQKLRLEGIEYKKYESQKFANFRNIAVEKQTVLEHEVQLNEIHINKLKEILKTL